MVNAAKRMRALTAKLYPIRNEAGSIVLPSTAPGPQLKSMFMRVPTGEFPNKEWFYGARQFWRKEMQRLKYWNPALSTNVETVKHGEKEPMYLTLEYESNNRDALEKIKAEPLPKPLLKIRPLRSHGRDMTLKRVMFADLRNMAPEDRLQKLQDTIPWIMQQLDNQVILHKEKTPKVKDIRPIKMTPELATHVPKDEIVVKAQPAADPSQPQSTSAPATLYSRKLSIPIAGLRHTEIWNWIRQHQGLRDHRRRRGAEQRAWQSLCAFGEAAQKDRRRVKRGVKNKKKEEKQLKNARDAAARIAADNV
ncbi:hypothetical protein LTS08_004346 [Lithohypha guttulata]|nr:hypothetical protein LTS08_004346 [Lithohypha guttulata]